jgi:hypothetical protein
MTTSFILETVANGVAAGGNGVGLAVDKAGNPSIAFIQPGNGQVVLARKNGGTWTHENAPSAFALPDSRPSLAIDSQGNPHIACKNISTGELVYVFKNGGQWSFKVIPTRLDGAHPTAGINDVALVLHPGHFTPQSRDAAYFVYVDLGTGCVGFAHTDAGRSPSIVQALITGLSFAGTSATFDGSENFFASYVSSFETGSPQPRMAVMQTQLTDTSKGTFSKPFTIDGTTNLNVRAGTSIARNAGGGCIAYCDNTTKTLKAAVAVPGGSDIETIASNVSPFIAPSAANNRFSNFRVAYTDHDGVKLASRNQMPDWTVEMVDAVSAGPASLVYDSNSNTAHIAYVTGGGVKHASRTDAA